jgi:hypothetical protein
MTGDATGPFAVSETLTERSRAARGRCPGPGAGRIRRCCPIGGGSGAGPARQAARRIAGWSLTAQSHRHVLQETVAGSSATDRSTHLAARTHVGELLVSRSCVAKSWKSSQFRVSRVSRASEWTESDRPASHCRGIRPNRGRPTAWSAIDRLPVRIRRGIDHPLIRSHPLCGEDGARSRGIPSRIGRRLGNHRHATCSPERGLAWALGNPRRSCPAIPSGRWSPGRW